MTKSQHLNNFLERGLLVTCRYGEVTGLDNDCGYFVLKFEGDEVVHLRPVEFENLEFKVHKHVYTL